MNFVQSVCGRQTHQYIGGNSDIGRYSKGQISAVGRSIYRSISR